MVSVEQASFFAALWIDNQTNDKIPGTALQDEMASPDISYAGIAGTKVLNHVHHQTALEKSA